MFNLPVYYCEIVDSDDGLSAISLVEFPATQSDFMCFSEQAQLKMQVQDEEQRIVSGVIILPDTPIYRNMNGKEFYVMFSKETIRKAAEKFFVDSVQSNVNTDHRTTVRDVNLLELFIKDSEKGINPNYVNCPEGSLIGTYKVNNDTVWESIKNGDFKGFSLEGTFSLIEKQNSEEDLYKELLMTIKKIKKVR